MAENHSTLTLGVAIAAALVVGAALGARSGDKIALASKRLEAQIAEQAAAVDARFAALGAEAAPAEAAPADAATADAATADAATAEAPQAEDPRIEALGARIDALDAQAATLGGQLARVAVIDDRVTVLAEQMAVMVSQLQALTDAAADTPAADTPAAETPAAESAAPAPAASAAAAPAAPSPDDVTLSVGQTATFGETPVFLSRVDVAAREAFVVVVGRGPASVGDSAGALALDDGCALRLVDARDRSAVLARVCAQ